MYKNETTNKSFYRITLFIIFTLFAIGSLQAKPDALVVTNLKAGKLRHETFKVHKVKRLFISGEMNEKDFKTIRKLKFLEYLDIKNVTIVNSKGIATDSLPDRAFENSEKLEGIFLPDSLISIGNSAFAGCFELEYSAGNYLGIIIPPLVANIGNFAFGGCSKIPRIEIPASVTTIGDKVYGCYLYDWDMDYFRRAICCKAYIEVDKNNPIYSSEKGHLYKQGKQIDFRNDIYDEDGN